MSVKVKAMKTLYSANKITIHGVRQAVVKGLLTVDEFTEITGQEY